jgi:hypothetical protein
LSLDANSYQIGAAVLDPQGEVFGLLIVTIIVNLGLLQGENPIYEAIVDELFS